MEKQRINWITVQSFTFPSEAHIAQSYLDSKGLQTFLKDELTIQTENLVLMHWVG